MNLSITNSRKWIILLITSVSTFMATLDGSIVNIALPVMSEHLKVDISSIQWVVTAYLLTISLLLLVWGRLSDLYGKKIIFASGFLVFSLGSAFCGLSHTLLLLVLSRILQAIGASAMMSLSQGIVTGIFPPSERGKALGFVGTMVAVGSLVGPSLGGILVHAFGWQSIFYINIPIGVAGSVLAFVLIPEIFEVEANKKFDFAGTFFFSAALLTLFLGLLLFQDNVISPGVFAALLAVSAVSLTAFIAVEKKTSSPLLDLGLFRIRTFSLGLICAYLGFIAINSTLLFMPFYLQQLLHYSALKAGLLISFYPITTAVVAPVSGWLSDKISYRPLTVAGMAVSTAALFALSTLSQNSSRFQIALLMVLLGAGVAIFQSPNNSSVMGSVERRQLGVAGGVNALFRNLGLVSGTTFSVLIFSFATKLSVKDLSNTGATNPVLFLKGFSLILIFDAVCCLAAALLSLTRAVGPLAGKRQMPKVEEK